MVGSALLRKLQNYSQVTILTAARSEVDLTDRHATLTWVTNNRPDFAFMAAAHVGGILANDSQPVQFLQDNLAIELSTVAACHEAGVSKLVFLGSSCIYPKHAAQPISEESLLTGPLEPTNRWYAVAKIAGILLCDAYRTQFGSNFISAMPTNLYGPNDNFDLMSSHVVAAAIRKIVEAKLSDATAVTIWGTGTPMREFMHVDDLADALIFLLQNYSEAGPINIGSGDEVSIFQLHEMIAEIVNYEGRFEFDKSRPDGTPRKRMDSSRLNALGWKPKIALNDGLRDMCQQYMSQVQSK